MHWYIWEKFRIQLIIFRIRTKFRFNLFRITVIFFLTDTCIGITNSSGEENFVRIASLRVKVVPD